MGGWKTKEQASAYNKKYAKAHPRKKEDKQRDYYAHRESRLATMHRYADDHREEIYTTNNTRSRKKIGWSKDAYQAAFISQGGCCAICGTHQQFLNRALNADHDHKTGLGRALLCMKCNTGLGAFSEQIELFEKAIDYIKTWSVVKD